MIGMWGIVFGSCLGFWIYKEDIVNWVMGEEGVGSFIL